MLLESSFWQQEQQLLKVLSSLSYRTGEIGAYLYEIASGVSRLIGSDWSIVTLCQDGKGEVIASSLGLCDGDYGFSVHGTLVGEVIQTGQVLFIEDVRLEPPERGKPPDPYLCYLGVPLQTPQGVYVGTICSFFCDPHHFAEEQIQLVKIFAERAATAIDNYQLYQHQQKFNETLEAEVIKRTVELRGTQAKLMELNLQLEKRVEERTLDLMQANQQLEAEIAERKRAEEVLRQSEERFRKLFENAGDSAFVFDKEGRILDVNQRACESLGYTREELLTLSIPDIKANYTEQELLDIREQLLSKKPITINAFQERKDGTVFPVEARLQEFEWNGEVLEIALVRDVTERKRAEEALRMSEERLRQLAENMEQAFWMVSLNKEAIYVSPAFEQIWGYSCDRWYEDPDLWWKAIHPDDQLRVRQAFGQDQAIKYDAEYRIIRPDGEIRVIRDQSFPIRDANGHIYRIAGIAEDITERRQLEQERLKAIASLAEVGELASMIVHEIRNPLTTILMGLTSCQRLKMPKPMSQRIQLSLEEAERLRLLLNEILLYAKPHHLQLTTLDLNSFVAELIRIAQTMPSAQKRSIQFVPASIAIYVAVDRDKLKQVLINLIDNACEAVADGDPVVCRIDQCHEYVDICVCNQGEPIPPEQLQQLTKPFYTTKSCGTGLGLAIVKRIVDAHAGEFQIKSSAEQGTIATVRLKCQEMKITS